MVNRNGLMKRRWEQASYTVEAAFVVPLGFLVLMSLSCLFTGAVKQNNVQMALLKTVQAYGTTQSRTSALQGIADQKVLIRWEEQGGEEFVCTDYYQRIPFLGSRLFGLHRYQQMAAVDYSGLSMVSDEEGDYFVYIAENGRVYHMDRECTYLRPRIRQDTVFVLKRKRNQSGGIYYPCESCCRSETQPAGMHVYYASYGERYHIREDCPKLKRTVRSVCRLAANVGIERKQQSDGNWMECGSDRYNGDLCCDGLPLEKGLDAACLGNGCLYFDLDTDVRRIFG